MSTLTSSRVVVVAALLGLVSGLCLVPAAGAQSPGKTAARALLSDVRVPPGAQLVHPSGTAMCQCAGMPGVVGLTDLTRYYVVSESPAATEKFLSTHVPRGGRDSGEGTSSSSGGVPIYSLTTTFKANGPHVYLRQLAYSTTRRNASTSWLRVDSQVVYVGARSGSQMIGAAASATVTGYRGVGLSGDTGPMQKKVSGGALGTLVRDLNSLALGPQNNCMETLNGFNISITLQNGNIVRVANGNCGGEFADVSTNGTSFVLADRSCGLIKYVASLFGTGVPAGTASALRACRAWEKAS